MWFFRNGLKIPGHLMMPAGYNTKESLRRTLEGKAKAGAKSFTELSYEELVEGGYVIVGSPQTVIEKYEQMIEDYRIGMVMSAGGHLGSMPHWMVQKNMYLMAEEVMPHFREADGKPTWGQHPPLAPQTYSEHAATVPRPERMPTVRWDGDHYLDTTTAHIPEVYGAIPGLKDSP